MPGRRRWRRSCAATRRDRPRSSAGRHEPAFEHRERTRSPRARPAARHGRHLHGLRVGRVLVDLEAGRHVEDGADRLAGDDRSRHERAAVANAIDLEPDRLLVIAAADEVRVQRVHPEGRIDGERPRPAAPAPRSGRRTARPTGTSGRCRRTCRARAARGSSSWRSPSTAVSGSAALGGKLGGVLFAELVATSAAVTSTSARSAKIAALADLLARLDDDEVQIAVAMLTGAPRQGRIGVGWRTVVNIDVPPADDAVAHHPRRRRRWSIDWPRPSGTGSNAARSALLHRRVRARHRRRGGLPATDVHRRAAAGRAGGRDGGGGGTRRRAFPRAAVRRAAMLGGDLDPGRRRRVDRGRRRARGHRPPTAATRAADAGGDVRLGRRGDRSVRHVVGRVEARRHPSASASCARRGPHLHPQPQRRDRPRSRAGRAGAVASRRRRSCSTAKPSGSATTNGRSCSRTR